MTYEKVKRIMDMGAGSVICKQFCIFPSQIATCIADIAYGNSEYGYVLIGAIKEGDNYCICGIDKHMNMENIIQCALKQVQIKTEIFYEICDINGKCICIIKVKTCDKIRKITSMDIIKMNKVLRNLLSACVKLQANSIYYGAGEDQRNDYIRDILDAVGYDVKDQTRRGLSPNGKAAGEVDILIKENDFPVAIIEALNLNSLNTSYLDRHIDKIYDYDTAGNIFNIILLYVTVANFEMFCDKYFEHIEKYQYLFDMISIERKIVVDDISYSDLEVMKTVHNRNSNETVLYHICVLIK